MKKPVIFLVTLFAAMFSLAVACNTNHVANNTGSPGAYVGNVPQTPAGSSRNTASDANPSVVNSTTTTYSYTKADAALTPSEKSYKNYLIQQYRYAVPHQWGENTTGVLTHMNTTDKAIALTFDACGGKGGSGYDAKLINYLIRQHIPATLFINSRWIEENYSTFMALTKNPLFEIENHGYLHSPLSINGKSAWGISGTQNVEQVVDEVLVNADKIQRLTGRRPIYFRSGTAYYDEDAMQIANDLGVRCVNFDILGDAGATFNTQQIVNACLQAKPGSIIICHMNHPEKNTAEGIMAVVPLLKQKGFHFVKLDTYPLV